MFLLAIFVGTLSTWLHYRVKAIAEETDARPAALVEGVSHKPRRLTNRCFELSRKGVADKQRLARSTLLWCSCYGVIWCSLQVPPCLFDLQLSSGPENTIEESSDHSGTRAIGKICEVGNIFNQSISDSSDLDARASTCQVETVGGKIVHDESCMPVKLTSRAMCSGVARGEVFYTPVHRNKTNLTAEDIAVLLDLGPGLMNQFLSFESGERICTKRSYKSALKIRKCFAI